MKFDRTFVDRIAEMALERFVDGASLNDIVRNIANEYDLNTEQVKRLCEAANVKVKRHLSEKTDNQFFTFELADWSKVIDGLQPATEEEIMDKEASIMRNDWEEFDNELFPAMEKTASTKSIDVDAVASLYTQVEAAEVKLRKMHNETRDKLASVSEELIEKIGKYFRSGEGSLIYSTALALVPRKSLIDDIFKTAADRYLFETCITPAYGQEKIAGAINYHSRFAIDLKEYFKLRYDLVKTANAYSRVQKARSKVLTAIRDILDKDLDSEPV